MYRRVAPFLLAVGLVAGCGWTGPPEVTFAVGDASVVARPTQYCNLEFTDCRNDPNAPVSLPVPVGSALRVEVPDEIADTPWQVVFTYRDAGGAKTDARSPVFAAASRRTAYDLQLPSPTDRLLTAQVQQFGPPPQANTDTGEIEFPIRASWVLTAAAAS